MQVKVELAPTNANNHDQPDTANWDRKTGLEALTNCFRQSVSYLYCTTLPRSLQNRQRLVPGVQIGLKLFLNDSQLFLFGTPDTTTSLIKKIPTLAGDDIFVTLHMLKVTLNASAYARLQKERALSKTKRVKYPVVRSEI